MKALIFNSGMGNRMGELTRNNPKCMVRLYNGETVFHRQLRILSECGIKEFIVTTGPFKEQLVAEAEEFDGPEILFVDNPDYQTTNYIVSMDKAYDFLNDDLLLLHGDLVFNKGIVRKLLAAGEGSAACYNEAIPLPDKDFKGRFRNGELKEVSVNIFDADCRAFQPLYKLTKADAIAWKEKVREFVQKGNTGVYAENALNEIADSLHIRGVSYRDDFVEEIDNAEDYERVCAGITAFDFREQPVFETDDFSAVLGKLTGAHERLFVVCSPELQESAEAALANIGVKAAFFSAFTPNPKWEEVREGAAQFSAGGYETIVSIGGGSAIDTAKAIKLRRGAGTDEDFLAKRFRYTGVRHIAVPTTAGTGSESTRFSVVYYKGEKQSIEHGCALPDAAVLDHSFLKTLPDYQKKSTLLDAFSQAIESFWSKGSSPESRAYSAQSLSLILKYYDRYLQGDEAAFAPIMLASNVSGRAINLTRTTAPHAMSYRLTSLYRVSHGHAVALCLIPCWRLLLDKSEHSPALRRRLEELAGLLGQPSAKEGADFAQALIERVCLPAVTLDPGDLKTLACSVNTERLGNNPVVFTKEELYKLYSEIG